MVGGGYGGEEVRGKSSDCVRRDAQSLQTLTGEGNLQGSFRRRAEGNGGRNGSSGEPLASCGCLPDVHQEIAGVGHVCITESHQPLNVAVVDRTHIHSFRKALSTAGAQNRSCCCDRFRGGSTDFSSDQTRTVPGVRRTTLAWASDDGAGSI